MTRSPDTSHIRILDLPGAINLRDFGGYPTESGARVRRGQLFRCGMLADLTSDAQSALHALRIGTICDLRRHDECAREPTPPLAHRPRQIHIPIDPDSGIQLRDALQYDDLGVEARIRYMVQINRELVRAHTAEYRQVFAALESSGDSAFLMHCSAGKDRTGLGAAAIQLALGVPRELVIEDYLLTNEAMDFERFIVPRLKPNYGDVDVEAAMALSGVRAEYIHAALDEIDSAFGSIDAYLRDGLGIDERRRAALRARYVE